MTQHAVAFAEIKALDSDQRIVEGWASRPELDRKGDVLASTGLQPLRGKINLLLDHNHKNAVGVVEAVSPSEQGVRFRARLAKITEPGELKTLCDDAWQMVLNGLRAAVSVGFLPLQREPLPQTGGWLVKKWEMFELSLVAVPACAGATIDTIKSLDRELLRKASSGRVVRLSDPVVRRTGSRSASTPTVASAMLDAAQTTEQDIERLRDIKELGPTTALLIRSQSAGAKATDAALAELRVRLAALEGRR